MKAHVQTEKNRCKAFLALLSSWGLDPGDPTSSEVAFRLLRRMTFEVVGKTERVRREVEYNAALQIEGNSTAVVAALGDMLDNNLGHEFHADELRAYVLSKGFRFRRLAGLPGLPRAIEELQNRFDHAIAPRFIAGTSIPRPESLDVVTRITADNPPRIVFVHGGAGAGKSVVLHQVFVEMMRRGLPVLPLQLHAYRPQGHPGSFGRDICGLPASPAVSLRGIAGSRRGILVLDQLDSLRLTSVHSHVAWEAFVRVVDEALADPELVVIAACRSFDLENDPIIAGWKRELTQFPGLVEIRIGELADNEVAKIVSPLGVTFTELNTRQRRLLRHPSNLALWVALAGAGDRQPAFTNATDLMRRFIDMRRRELVSDHAVAESDVHDTLTRLVTYLDREGRLDAPSALLADRRAVVDALCSVGLLIQEGASLTFVHQTYFDHLLAEQVLTAALRSDCDIDEWVRRNQSLFRRDQLRQLLTMLRDSDPGRHGSLVASILRADDIRFHLKHLVLGLLRQAEPVADHEAAIVAELSHNLAWWEHVLGVIWRRVPWFDTLEAQGMLSEWLTDHDDDRVRQVLRFLLSVVDARGEHVDRLVAQCGEAREGWTDRLLEVLPFDPCDDSPRLAALRLERVEAGEIGLDGTFTKELAQRRPEQLVRLMAAGISAWVRRLKEHMRLAERQAVPEWRLREEQLDNDVLDAIRTQGRLGWELFSGSLCTIARLRRVVNRRLRTLEDYAWRSWDIRHTLNQVHQFVESLFTAAVAGLARDDPVQLTALLDALSSKNVRGLERAITTGLAAGDAALADRAIDWLVQDSSRFRLGDGYQELHWQPARALLQRFAEYCSDAHFSRLESAILGYHDKWETRSVQVQLDHLRRGQLIPNDWGRAQNVLLAALPLHRMSPEARSAAATWRGKFGDAASERPTSALGSGGIVTSPIPHDRLLNVSDREWLKIIRTNWAAHGDGRWRQLGPETVAEASLRTFVHSFEEAVRRDPRRFASLALRIPRHAIPDYFTALVRGLTSRDAPQNIPAWEPASVSALEAVFRHVGSCDSDEYVQAVCRAVRSRHEEAWSDETMDRLLSYISHPDPKPGQFSAHRGTGREGEMRPDVGGTALGCVRGAVASALTSLLWSRQDADERLVPAIERLVTDPHPAVRYEALGACLPIWNRDRVLAVRLAVSACGHEDDRVLESRWLNRLIGIGRATHLAQLGPVIERMARSSEANIAESGSAWATACWFDSGHFLELVDICCAGSDAQRRGVATAALQYFAHARAVDQAGPILVRLFSDPEREIRSHAARVFWREGVFSVPETPSLALSFVHSAAYLDDSRNLLHPLSEYSGNILYYVDVLLEAADIMTRALAAQTCDLRQRQAFAGDELSVLLLRVYDQSHGSHNRELQDQCLDRWDRMLKGRVGMTERHLRALDD